jgi:hypothetical protein
MKRQLLALISASVLGAAVLAGPAGADPIHAKNAAQIHAVCGTQTVNVVVNGGNGNGAFLPAHVLGSTSMFIPTSVHLTISFTPAGGGGPFVNTTNATKASPSKSGAVTCTIPLQTLFSGPQGSATIQGTVTGFYTPR